MAYFGALVGPVANRIAGAQVDHRRHAIIIWCANEPPNTLHGGPARPAWRGSGRSRRAAPDRVRLSLDAGRRRRGLAGQPPDRARGWRLLPGAALELELTATSDRPTCIDLAQHGYWRLGPGDDLAGHRLTDRRRPLYPCRDARLPAGTAARGGRHRASTSAPRARSDPGPAPTYDHNFCLADAPRPAEPSPPG